MTLKAAECKDLATTRTVTYKRPRPPRCSSLWFHIIVLNSSPPAGTLRCVQAPPPYNACSALLCLYLSPCEASTGLNVTTLQTVRPRHGDKASSVAALNQRSSPHEHENNTTSCLSLNSEGFLENHQSPLKPERAVLIPRFFQVPSFPFIIRC